MKRYFMFGKAGTGKDTVSEILKWKLNVKSLALADPIRDEYQRFFGKSDYKQNREKMIAIGEGYKKIYGEDIWCRMALEKIKVEFMQKEDVLIRDGRYEMEYDFFVVKHNFIPIRLVADDEIRFNRLNIRDGNVQASSLEFEAKHFISDKRHGIMIDNSGTIDELIQRLSEVME